MTYEYYGNSDADVDENFSQFIGFAIDADKVAQENYIARPNATQDIAGIFYRQEHKQHNKSRDYWFLNNP